MSAETLTTFLFEAANFVAFVALLAWLFYKPVRRVLEAQRSREREGRDASERDRQEAKRLREEAEAQQARLDAELSRERTSRMEAARVEAADVLEEARKTAERERKAARREALQIREGQRAHLAEAVAATARESVARLLARLGGGDLDHALIEAVCRVVDGKQAGIGSHALVITAAPLEGADRERLAVACGGDASFRVDPALGGGVRIESDQGLLDASFAGMATHAHQVLQGRLAALLRETDADA